MTRNVDMFAVKYLNSICLSLNLFVILKMKKGFISAEKVLACASVRKKTKNISKFLIDKFVLVVKQA